MKHPLLATPVQFDVDRLPLLKREAVGRVEYTWLCDGRCSPTLNAGAVTLTSHQPFAHTLVAFLFVAPDDLPRVPAPASRGDDVANSLGAKEDATWRNGAYYHGCWQLPFPGLRTGSGQGGTVRGIYTLASLLLSTL